LVKRALQTERNLPPAMWVLNVCIETQLPTIALVLLIKSGFVDAKSALTAPVILLYFLFIILSTLRLSPTLSILTGLASALGYIAVVTVVGAVNTAPAISYLVYAGLILGGGVVAGVVAGQIRNHVFAALREAELQSQLTRINQSLDIARSIQQGLLPSRSPKLDDFDLAGWNQPADQTGGDYFDWQLLPNGLVAISLGDATGHGIGPALVSASCRAYARASFLNDGGQNGLLDRLNGLLAEDLAANHFVTYAVVFLDPAHAHVKVLSAGHGPILHYRHAVDRPENLEAQGIPLGMIPGVKYAHAIDRELAAGDMLVLVTDVFYEWTNPEGEEFGIDRLEDVISESRQFSAEEIIARLRSAVLTFCKGT